MDASEIVARVFVIGHQIYDGARASRRSRQRSSELKELGQKIALASSDLRQSAPEIQKAGRTSGEPAEATSLINSEALDRIREDEVGLWSPVATACIPCAMGHYGTCSGLLNEAMRFAKKEGIDSGEVIDRVNMCMDELNAMERVDLRPELIADLSRWEKELANKALTRSRSLRHGLENLGNVDDLERLAATTQTIRNEIGRDWFKRRLASMGVEDNKAMGERAQPIRAKLGEKEVEKGWQSPTAPEPPPAVIPTEPQPRPHRETDLEYIADSPEYLAQTIDNTGYRSKLDNAFQEAIARVKGLK